jgi:steroid delta-isomerase
VTLLERHVELFNQGVRSGDFGPMLEHFTDDAELVFEGVPVGPFHGKETIAAAYASNPPDDEVDVLASEQADDGTIVARYPWRADGGRSSGRMIFTQRGEQIARLVVTFE